MRLPPKNAGRRYDAKMSATSSTDADTWKLTKPVGLRHLCFWLLLATCAIAILVGTFTFILRGQFVPWNLDRPLTARELQQVVQSAVTTAAALGLGVTLYLSFRKQKTADDNYATTLELLRLQQDQHRQEGTARLRDRYVKAAEQLGSTSQPMRLAGIYALASLADDWNAEDNSKERQVCINLLTSYFALDTPASEGDYDRGPERETIWSTVLDRVARGKNNGGWPGAEVRLRNAGLDHMLKELDVNFGVLDFFTSPIRNLQFLQSTFRRAQLRMGEVHAEGGWLRFTLCTFEASSVIFHLHAAGLKREVQWEAMFFHCQFNGSAIALGGEGGPTSGFRFENCYFDEECTNLFVQPSGRAPALGYLEFHKCTFGKDILSKADLSQFSRVEITGIDDNDDLGHAMSDTYTKKG